jgi:hypothetical protein
MPQCGFRVKAVFIMPVDPPCLSYIFPPVESGQQAFYPAGRFVILASIVILTKLAISNPLCNLF